LKDKKPTRKELYAEIERLEDILTIQTLETNLVFGIFDQAVEKHCDPVTVERIRQTISELTKPESDIII